MKNNWILPAKTSFFAILGIIPEIVENNDISFLHSQTVGQIARSSLFQCQWKRHVVLNQNVSEELNKELKCTYLSRVS